MSEIKLTSEDLKKFALIAKTLRDKGMPAAEKMFNESKLQVKLQPKLVQTEVSCNTCVYCGICGPTALAWVGVDLVLNAAGA